MALRIIALDIETDTDGTPERDSAVATGLDPRFDAIISVAVHDTASGDSVAFTGEEKDILTALDAWFSAGPYGLIATWNGANFDLPYLARRYEHTGVATGLVLAAADDRPPKYEALVEAHPNGYWGRWYHHGHIDVAYAYKDYAQCSDVPWSLKPVCVSLGIDMVSVDRTAVSQLIDTELRDYNVSDVIGTAALAERLETEELALRCDPNIG